MVVGPKCTPERILEIVEISIHGVLPNELIKKCKFSLTLDASFSNDTEPFEINLGAKSIYFSRPKT